MYEVSYSREAFKTLQSLPRNLALKIQDKIERLALDPAAAANVKKLVGRAAWRLRVGDWRVIYELEQGRLVVQVMAIAPRGKAYQ